MNAETSIQQPTKTQWLEVETDLQDMFKITYFDCDGYLVAASLERVSTTRLAIQVFVNGFIRGAWGGTGWVDGDPSTLSPEATRFWCLKAKALYSRKEIAGHEKAFGKRRARKMGNYKKYNWATPEWRSAKSFIRHLKKNNTRIQVINHETHTLALAERKNEPAS